ncbi:MAG TPA: hypothetical protein VEX38_00425, partial [Fimbriimonadaceae bacterium]|nr:hypothetical protein [Fimbriimonadaceae bacterium]
WVTVKVQKSSSSINFQAGAHPSPRRKHTAATPSNFFLLCREQRPPPAFPKLSLVMFATAFGAFVHEGLYDSPGFAPLP